MLKNISLEHVGPAPGLAFKLGKRLNLFTGDNSAGKTFLLDVAWWALTRTWGTLQEAVPSYEKKFVIAYQIEGRTRTSQPAKCPYDYQSSAWKIPARRPPIPGLVVYARVDGGFSVWDPARNYWKESSSSEPKDGPRPEAFSFSQSELWNGLRTGNTVTCKGLLWDLREWQIQANGTFSLFSRVLDRLSPGSGEALRIEGTSRPYPGDARDIPTLALSYGRVPITHTSSGVRRILGLAYLLVWAWTEHQEAAKKRMEEPEQRMVVLFDEIEAHLHPKWQRLVLPALMEVIHFLRPDLDVQLLVATHSPLVLASAEPFFDTRTDRLFTLDLEGQSVEINEGWAKQGDALNWLVSETFGLKQARSIEAERAITAANAWMLGEREGLPEDLKTQEAIHKELLRVLPGNDRFWPRWIVRLEREGGQA